MVYRILDGKIIKAFKKYLEENQIKFKIEWKPCAVALFFVDPEPEQRWHVQYGYYDVQYKIYG